MLFNSSRLEYCQKYRFWCIWFYTSQNQDIHKKKSAVKIKSKQHAINLTIDHFVVVWILRFCLIEYDMFSPENYAFRSRTSLWTIFCIASRCHEAFLPSAFSWRRTQRSFFARLKDKCGGKNNLILATCQCRWIRGKSCR